MIHKEIFKETLEWLRITSRSTDADVIDQFNRALSQSMANRTIDVLTMQGYRGIYGVTATTDYVVDTGTPGTNGYQGEYVFPTDMLRLISIVVNNKKVEIYDVNDVDLPTSGLYATMSRGNYKLSETPDATVTGGIVVHYQSRQPVFLGSVDTQTKMLALGGTEDYPSKTGDWCYRTDESKMYILKNDDNTSLSSWENKEFEPKKFEQNIHGLFAVDCGISMAEKNLEEFGGYIPALQAKQYEFLATMKTIYKIAKGKKTVIRYKQENFK